MWWLGGLAMVCGLVGAFLHAANAAVVPADRPTFALMLAAAAAGYGALTIVLRGRTTPALRATVAAIGVSQGIALLTAEWAQLVGDTGLILWVGSWLWSPGYVAIAALLPHLLPDGRPAWKAGFRFGVLAVVVTGLNWSLTPYSPIDYPDSTARNPVAVDLFARPAVGGVVAALDAAAVVVALAALVVRWRRSSTVQRRQLTWVLLALAATLVLAGLSFLTSGSTAQVVAALAILPLPAAIAVAVLRYGLWSVDTVASRALTYTLAGAVSGCVFGLVRWAFELVASTDPESVSLVAAVLAGLVTVTAYAALQRSANWLVHGSRREPGDILDRLGDRLGGALDADDIADAVLPSALADLGRVLRLDRARLELADRTDVRTGSGEPTVDSITLPLRYGGEEVGRLMVDRAGGFDPEERQTLDRLAGQAAVAAHTVLLERRLRLSREQVVLAREEERRRVRRDLHDGVGPSLAAVALQLETARDLAGHDAHAAAGLLDRLAPRVNALVADVRALVLALRPPTLDELGLAAATRELAARLSTDGTRVQAVAAELGPLPAAVEVAAYRIVGEAAANAVRHAHAAKVTLRLRRSDDGLSVQVTDDGLGLAADAGKGGQGAVGRQGAEGGQGAVGGQGAEGGLGIPSMRQRAEELGGTLHIDSDRSGTTVTATLPLAREAPEPASAQPGSVPA